MHYDDLINDTLLIAYEKMGTLKSEKAFLSYLFSISVRLLANNHKKKKPELGVGQDSFSDPIATSSDENPEQAAEVHLLHKALAHVPVDQREAIILFEISGFATREIAEIQNTSEVAVRQRLKRGRDRLTQILTFESEFKLGKESAYE